MEQVNWIEVLSVILGFPLGVVVFYIIDELKPLLGFIPSDLLVDLHSVVIRILSGVLSGLAAPLVNMWLLNAGVIAEPFDVAALGLSTFGFATGIYLAFENAKAARKLATAKVVEVVGYQPEAEIFKTQEIK